MLSRATFSSQLSSLASSPAPAPQQLEAHSSCPAAGTSPCGHRATSLTREPPPSHTIRPCPPAACAWWVSIPSSGHPASAPHAHPTPGQNLQLQQRSCFSPQTRTICSSGTNKPPLPMGHLPLPSSWRSTVLVCTNPTSPTSCPLQLVAARAAQPRAGADAMDQGTGQHSAVLTCQGFQPTER